MTAHKFLKIDSSTGLTKEESGVSSYSSSGDEGKLVALASSGKIDPSLIPSGGGGGAVYTRRADEVTVDLWYVGDAEVGSAESAAVWKIAQVTFTGNSATRTYADGNSNFDNIWNDRASYTYS